MSCVEFVRHFLDIPYDDFNGFAGDIAPNTQEGRVGIVLITFERQHHVSVIIDETEDTWILAEANYDGYGLPSEGREIEKISPVIRGYFDPELIY